MTQPLSRYFSRRASRPATVDPTAAEAKMLAYYSPPPVTRDPVLEELRVTWAERERVMKRGSGFTTLDVSPADKAAEVIARAFWGQLVKQHNIRKALSTLELADELTSLDAVGLARWVRLFKSKFRANPSGYPSVLLQAIETQAHIGVDL